MVNRTYLKEILAGSKKLLSLDEVKWVIVPKYDELAVKSVMGQLKEDVKFQLYFPSKLPKGRIPDRTYFYNVLNTIYP